MQIKTVESLTVSSPDTDSGPYFVEIPYCREPVECFAINSTLHFGGGPASLELVMAPRFSNISIDRGQPIVRVNGAISNLGHYWINSSALSRFQLSDGVWNFDFVPIRPDVLEYPEVLQDKDYLLTHNLTVTRVDAGAFDFAQADAQLALISTFLSFCHGGWVSPVLVGGVDAAGITIMEQWGTRQLSPWRDGNNWLDQHHGEAMMQLFRGFVKRMADPEWNDIVHRALYWYIRADTNLIGPDGATVLLQAALETLAWQVLVKHRRALSEDGFSKMIAADQLRLLLDAARIPLTIPATLPILAKMSRADNLRDAPQAFVEIRNRIVHPPKKKKNIEQGAYYEAYVWAKWCIELVLLRAFGYNGAYSNRINLHRWVGQVETVPWAGPMGSPDL